MSCVARVEVPAALWRKRRTGELGSVHARTLTDVFEADYFGDGTSGRRFLILGIPDEVLDEAAHLVATHALRAYDGIQLASALAAREVDPECNAFACFDDGLRAAAAANGLTLIP